MKFINLTPHTLNIQRIDGSMLILPPSGVQCRVEVTRVETRVIMGVQISRPIFGEIENSPPRGDANANGDLFIVSGQCRTALMESGRYGDVFSPGDLLRDGAGRPIGCIGLAGV